MKFWQVAKPTTIAFLMSFYPAFVFQMYWNWFVVPTLHLSDISYITAFALWILVGWAVEVFSHEQADRERFAAFSQALDVFLWSAVPDDKREDVEFKLKAVQEDVTNSAIVGLWERIAVSILLNSGMLGFGFVLHFFA